MDEWRRMYSVANAEERIVILLALLMTEEVEKKNKWLPELIKRHLLWLHWHLVIPLKRVKYNRAMSFTFIYASVTLFFHTFGPREYIETLTNHMRYFVMVGGALSISLTIYGITDTVRGVVRKYL